MNSGTRKIPSSPALYRFWDLKKFQKFGAFPPYIGSRTWKYSELSPYTDSDSLYSLWDLEKSSLYMLWDLEERSTERSEMRVAVYSFLPTWRSWDLEKFQAFPLYMGSWTYKNSDPTLSERGLSRRDMKHDLHFSALPLNTFPLFWWVDMFIFFFTEIET